MCCRDPPQLVRKGGLSLGAEPGHAPGRHPMTHEHPLQDQLHMADYLMGVII